jgi:hypothetical protein
VVYLYLDRLSKWLGAGSRKVRKSADHISAGQAENRLEPPLIPAE